MKILSISLSLAAVAFAAAQAEQAAFDPLGPSSAQIAYTWGTESTDAAELSPDEFAYAVSELRFRSDLLSWFEEMQNKSSTELVADAADCSAFATAVSAALATAEAALQKVIATIGQFAPMLETVFAQIGNALSNLSALQDALVPLKVALQDIQSIIPKMSIPGLDTLETPIQELLNQVQNDITCLSGGSKLFIEATTCNSIADMYRIAVAEAVKSSPALNLPESASVDLRRLAAGSLSVLDLMGKNAIATTNEGLLSIRPIFATELLNQFREELLRTESVDIKKYAQRDLSVVVGISNALEACLRVAADPVAAIDDLNEELEAAEQDYDEEDDIDEDEDEDEADETNEAPKQQQ